MVIPSKASDDYIGFCAMCFLLSMPHLVGVENQVTKFYPVKSTYN